MGYKIGSFNLHKLGKNADANGRDLNRIAEIIREEDFDVVALQEISTGEAFTDGNAILSILGSNYDFRRGNAHGDGLGFLWKKSRLRLVDVVDKKNPRILEAEMNEMNLSKAGYYARFTPNGLPGGCFFELRLICVHIIFGDDIEARKKELNCFLKEIYPRYSTETDNSMPNYTILLGDYNLELFRDGRNKDKCIDTNAEGIVISKKYNDMRILTVQDEPSTISGAEDDYVSNYDHFSFDYDKFQNLKYKVSDLGYNYEDLQKFKKEISDHIPIKMEIELK